MVHQEPDRCLQSFPWQIGQQRDTVRIEQNWTPILQDQVFRRRVHQLDLHAHLIGDRKEKAEGVGWVKEIHQDEVIARITPLPTR